MQHQHQEPKQTLSIPVAIIIAGALIAFGIYWSGRGNSQPAPVASNNVQTQPDINLIKQVGQGDHVLGDLKTAKMVLVEYSDTECPFCKQFHNTLHQLVTAYDGKLAWAVRYFPVHQKSVKEAEALECAAELGGNDAYWKYIDKVFELTNSNDTFDLTLLPQIAGDLGLDVTKFNACLSSGKYAAKVEQDKSDVIRAGAQGTPFSVIFANGEKIPLTQGALPFNDMKNILDTILKKS